MAPDDGRVISNFVQQALKGEDITIHGDGSQTRSLMYIHDLVRPGSVFISFVEEGD
jgi:UDP-glucuronate decarboxylase